MMTYRSQGSFQKRFARRKMPTTNEPTAPKEEELFATQSYLRYQGEKFVRRFDANCYIVLTRLLDSHDLSRGRGNLSCVLSSIEQPSLVIGNLRGESKILRIF